MEMEGKPLSPGLYDALMKVSLTLLIQGYLEWCHSQFESQHFVVVDNNNMLGSCLGCPRLWQFRIKPGVVFFFR